MQYAGHVSYTNFVMALLTIEFLWLSGRASKRRIRSSEVRFLTVTQNFSWVDDGGPGRPNLWGVQIRWDTGKSLPRLHGCVIKLKAEMKNKVAFLINCEFLSKRKKALQGFHFSLSGSDHQVRCHQSSKYKHGGKLLIEKGTFLLTWYTFFHHLLLHLLCTVVVALTCTGRKIIYFCLSWIFLTSNYQRLTIKSLDKTKKKIK